MRVPKGSTYGEKGQGILLGRTGFSEGVWVVVKRKKPKVTSQGGQGVKSDCWVCHVRVTQDHSLSTVHEEVWLTEGEE